MSEINLATIQKKYIILLDKENVMEVPSVKLAIKKATEIALEKLKRVDVKLEVYAEGKFLTSYYIMRLNLEHVAKY